jgi:hypothetical protein
LPDTITFIDNSRIVYIYDASGAKLRKKSTNKSGETTITDYCGELEFTNSDLSLIHTGEGVVTFTRIMQRKTKFAYCISAIEVRDSIRVNPAEGLPDAA